MLLVLVVAAMFHIYSILCQVYDTPHALGLKVKQVYSQTSGEVSSE